MQDTDPAPAISQAERLAAWIRLEQTPGVGCATVRILLEKFGDPQRVLDAGCEALAGLVPAGVASALRAPLSDATAHRIRQALAWLADPQHHLLTLHDPAYPPLLLQIADPPVLLYASGRLELLSRPALAMVGSRNASAQGLLNAAAFGHALSSAGMTIVSGMALGIDAAAHEGALRAGGSTVAVIGTGADRIYPRRNQALAYRIAEQGCIVSEYPLGMPALADNFPRRNRIISGLACAVLVVEAAAKSGSLITARLAADQGRDVFAIPGSIHSPLAKGCHGLIKAGARLVESVDDLLDELRLAPLAGLGLPSVPGYSGEHRALLHALGQGPVDGDTLGVLCGLAPGCLSGQLLMLELAGQVERLPGGLFQRINR